MIKQSFSLIFSCFALNSAYAATCSSYQQDKATHYANIQGNEVVNKYDGGRNIRTYVSNCDYNNYSNKYNVDIDVYWDGVMSGKSYNSSGKMIMNPDGGRREYQETYRNQNLKDYALFKGMAMLALVTGSSSSPNSQSGTNQVGYRVWVKNKCGWTRELVIEYKDAKDGQWKKDGWWSFAPEEAGYLSNIRTNKSTLYYALKDNSITQNYNISYGGNTYPADKVTDNEGDTEIYLCAQI
ncbi:hypothetical protein [Moraxella oblonga]|uniref:hypothetical protein n=1 Tax=Moraxella oblonga TaxID=200413 RepID=UPI00082E514A|nr:hypothetical protein [Moraxella oblonga]